ncbi:hypothetical protein SteCoe_2488 [Stentor coeruleus]|uniref:TNFR-Cys domain-containing protein n=1 Tax=Stentor coeruleus TaxID=5963 RepID=A0A1R2CZK7_9CILI|nr:hypothetical protein SteCoe_2488 [Stentor coeruleus]
MLIFCLFLLPSAMMHFNNSECLSCETNYFHYRNSCLSLCPFGYLESTEKCDKNSSLYLFDENFAEFYVYNFSSFNTYFEKFNTENVTEETFPIPTRDRGLYISNDRFLESLTSFIPSPDITILLSFRLFSSGTLLSLSTPLFSYFEILAEENSIYINATKTNNNFTENFDIRVVVDYSSWIIFTIKFQQNQNNFTIITQNIIQTYIEETRYQDENSTWILGSSEGKSFTGFLAKIWVYNDFLVELPIDNKKFNLCNFQEYYDAYNGICLNHSCNQTWPISLGQGCIFNDLPGCGEAFGYLDIHCLNCENTNFTIPYCKCGEFCVNCTEEFPYNCTQCDDEYTLISGLCVRNCYNCTDEYMKIYEFPFYNIVDEIINGFYSGNHQVTWSPFNNTDTDDPKFSPYRGLYFQGSQYLQSQNFSISPKSFWAFWIKAETFGCIWCSKVIKIYSNGYCELILSNSVHDLEEKTTNSSLSLSWSFITISIDYLLFPETTTTINIEINNTFFETKIFELLLIDRGINIFIGADDSQTNYKFIGFIYYLEYAWNYIPLATISQYNIFSNFNMSSCDYLQYYNDITLRCENCDQTCINGCSTFGSCSLCENISCSICSNFNDINCESNEKTCINSLYYFSDFNKCCAEGCQSSCSGPSPCDCVEINFDSKYSINDICCFSECPTGYTISSDRCTKSQSQILTFSFNKSEITIENDNYGNTLYNNNGIPAVFRGYYYSSTSFANTSLITLSYEFSLYLWFKAIIPGLLLSIDNLQVILETSSINVSISSNSFSYLNMSNNWSRLKIQQYVSNTQGFLLIELLNYPSSTFIKSTTCNFFKGSLLLGAGFTGFLWKLTIYNDLVSESLNYITCNSTIIFNCLWPCDIKKYFSLGYCYDCNPSCSSCRNSKNCNLCFSDNCESCVDYETRTCDKCSNSLSGSSNNIYCDFTFNKILYTQQTDDYGNTIYFVVPGISYAPGSQYKVPVPLAFRGYYFDVLSVAQSTSISLTDTFNITIWICQIGYGHIFTMDNFKVFSNSTGTYISNNYTFTNNSGTYNQNNVFFFNLRCNAWTILRIKKYMQGGMNYISLDFYPYQGFTIIEPISCRFLNGNFTLGKPSSSINSFFGFIYRIAIYSGDSIIVSKIDFCVNSKQSNCLWNCPYGTYLDSNGVCTNCKYNCFACRNSNDCTQCANSICQNCQDYLTCTSCIKNGYLSQDLCYCNDQYTNQLLVNGTTECSEKSECFENDSRYRVDSCCYTSCPKGYTLSNQECIKVSDTILDLTFNRMEVPSFSDAYKNTYYVNSSLPSPFRGYYFSGSTNGNISSLILAPNITLQIWAKVIYYGTFLAIENFVLSVVSQGFEITIPDNSYISYSSFSTWDAFVLQKYVDSYNLTYVRVYQQIKNIYIEFPLQENCAIWEGNIIFGKSNNKVQGFTGFIWRIVGINGVIDEVLDVIVCSASVTEGCLWDCNFNQYFNAGNCYYCLSNCTTCRNGNDCILCVNSICKNCSYYYNCTTCINNAALVNNVCECNTGFYSLLDLSMITICKLSGICDSATPNDYIIDQCCYKLCPSSYSLSNSSCILSRSNILDFHLDSLSEMSIVDSYSNTLTILSPPYPYIHRGYYMSSNCYIHTETFFIPHSTTLLMWIRQYSPGLIFRFEYLKVSSNNTGFILKYSNNNYFFPAQIFTWGVLVIQRWNENNTGNIAMQFYPSSKYQFTEINPCNFMNGNLYIGIGFYGFIWRIQWINGVYNDNPELVVCTASVINDCLWDCPINDFFNSTVGACQSCLSSCAGCKQSYDCSLCANSLCKTCDNYYTCSECITNTTLVNGVCECKTNFYMTTLSSGALTCLNCAPTCQTTCYGPSPCDCNDYNSLLQKIIIDRCCSKNCPLGFILSSSICIRSISKIANFELNRIEYDQWIDEYGNIFYVKVPSFIYSSNATQPIPVSNRGYYYSAVSFTETSQIIMNFEFTISVWIKVITPGLIFSIDDLQLIYEISCIKIKQDNNEYTFLISSDKWEILVIKRWLEISKSYFALQFYNTGATVNDYKICNFLDGAFTFGGGFEGFIWKIEIYNQLVSITNSLIICSDINCIWNCQVNEIIINSGCQKCNTNCNTCTNLQDCNLCPNSLCRSCSDYQKCTSCADFASLVNDVCKCDIKYYEYLLNPGYSLCYKCSELCLDYCLGPNACDCLNINLPTKYNLDLCCFSKCPNGFELIGNSCSFVNSTIMDYVFDILERQNDIYGNSFTLGNTTLTQYKGLYFSNCDFVISNNIVLGYNFSLHVWVKVISDGIFLSLGGLLIKTDTNGVTLTLLSNNHFYNSIGYNWIAIIIQKWTENGVGMISYRTLSSIFVIEIDGEPCIQLEGNLQLGSASLGFSGFVYRISLYNELIDIFEGITLCSSTLASGCLWECNFNDYIECQVCKTACEPCANHKCNYCQSLLCQSCVDFDICEACIDGYYIINISGVNSCYPCFNECKTCSQDKICETCVALNSHVSSTQGCLCNDKYYGSNLISIDSCLPCHQECKTCSKALICDTCISSNSYPSHLQGCLCNDGFYGINLINADSCLSCYQECKTCSDAYICDTCITLNASPTNIKGCVCKDGFYGSNLTIVDSCLSCYQECKTCSQASICDTCIALNSFASSTQGCICKDGYYGNNLTSKNSCLACYRECKTCSKDLICDTCISLNASTKSTQGCICNDGFYGNNLIKPDSCLPCYQECKTCSYSYICDTCKALNAFATSTLGCSCNDGFYGKNLIESDSCLPCHEECKTCSQANICDICLALNSHSTSNLGCLCNDGYYGINLIKIDSCLPCHQECKTCSQDYICDTCISLNSSATLVQGCLCDDGFYGNNLIDVDSCKLCFDECKTCSKAFICDTCIALNATPTTTRGCQCNEGFYGKFLVNNDSCKPCYEECKTCSEENICNECITLNAIPTYTQGCICKDGFYGSNLTSFESCLPCSSECKTCSQADVCDTCIDINASPDIFRGCSCNDGYYRNNPLIACERKEFTASISITESNIITLFFIQDLSQDLKQEDINLSIQNYNLSFIIEKITESSYKITPKLSLIYNQDSILKIEFLNDIISVSNFTLSKVPLSIHLFLTKEMKAMIKENQKAEEAKTTAKLGISTSIGITLGFSFLTFDPSSFFDFLNTAEILYAAALFHQDLNIILFKFLLSLRTTDILPSIYDNLINENDGVPMPQKLQDFGYKTNLIIINAGVQLTTFTILIVNLIFITILSNFKCLNKRLEGIRKSYRYGVFLRFWLQTYFEVLIIVTFGLKYNKWENNIQIIDGTIGILIIVISIKAGQIFGLGIFIYFLVKRVFAKSEEQIKLLESTYSTFIEEFNTSHLRNMLYYFLYILRRTILVLTFHFSTDEGLQLALSIGISFTIFLYVAITRLFKEKSTNLYHVINELIISTFYYVIIIEAAREKGKFSQKSSRICIALAMCAWSLNIVFSIFNNVYLIISKIKTYIYAKRERRIGEVYRVRTVFENEVNEANGDNKLELD